jgi:hypothetical protein
VPHLRQNGTIRRSPEADDAIPQVEYLLTGAIKSGLLRVNDPKSRGNLEVDMRKSVLAVLSASAMALAGIATSANAASVVTGPVPSVLTPPASAIFGANVTGGPTSFNDTFTFTVAGTPGAANAQVSTILLNGSQNINFSSITLDGNAFVKTSADGTTTEVPETWALLNPVLVGIGTHTINVMGNLIGPNGSYSGTLNVQAVPEPASWAMMLIGFGAMGLAVRRRRRPALAQLA